MHDSAVPVPPPAGGVEVAVGATILSSERLNFNVSGFIVLSIS